MKNAVAAPRPTIADTSISAENFSHRQLIPKLQAFSQSIQETSMVRFYSSIYSDDKMLITSQHDVKVQSMLASLTRRAPCR
jgi:hypothetical protein